MRRKEIHREEFRHLEPPPDGMLNIAPWFSKPENPGYRFQEQSLFCMSCKPPRYIGKRITITSPGTDKQRWFSDDLYRGESYAFDARERVRCGRHSDS